MSLQKKAFYLSKFKGKIFVVKIGGEVIRSKAILKSILLDIKDLITYGVKVILVHGGGTQADELSKQLGHVPKKVNGRRVTKEQDLEIAKMLYGGSLNLEILSLMKELGVKGIRVSGLDGGLLTVKIRCKKKFDYGYVGDVEEVHPQILLDVLRAGYLPIVSPLGVTNEGVIVNINADTIATEIASKLQVEKLIFCTSTEGVYDGEKLLRTLTISEAAMAIDKGIIAGGMRVKIENCIHVINSGVKRVQVLNGLSPHSILKEILTKRGVGTMIISDDERQEYLKE